jgi:CDP-diacylglycerol---serine O-phosphatidyltransferase
VTTPPEKSRYASPEQAARIYLLPNLFTAGNMLCGFLSIKNLIEARFASGADNTLQADHYLWAVWFILFACLCDLFDGRAGNRCSAPNSTPSRTRCPSASRRPSWPAS